MDTAQHRETFSLGSDLLSRRLLAGGAWVFSGRILAALSVLITNAFLARLLTAEDLGAYFLASSLVLFGGIAGCFGLKEAVVRLVAEGTALRRFANVRRAVSLTFRLATLTSIGLGVVYVLYGNLLASRVLHIAVLGSLSGLLAFWIVLVCFQNLLAETFRGFSDMFLATLFGGLSTGILVTISLVLLWLSREPVNLATVVKIAVAAVSVSVLWGAWLLRRKLARLPISSREKSDLDYKKIVSLASPLLVTSITLFLLTQLDIWMLGIFRSAREVAVYGAASRLAQLVSTPLLIANALVPPIIAELYARQQTRQLEQMLRKIATLTAIPALLASAVFFVLPGATLRIVYGPFYRSGVMVLILLAFGQLVNVWAGSCGFTLTMTGHQNTMMAITLLTGLLTFVGTLAVVREYGPVGVAAVSCFVMVLQNVLMLVFARKRIGVWTHARFIPTTG